MLTATVTSLSGGQGKTTTAYFVGKLLSAFYRVLVVDADPQANLTFYLGHEVGKHDPTLLELLTGQVKAEQAFYETSHGVFLIPADRGLVKAQDYLSSTGMSARVLRASLEPLSEYFDFALIDSPPARGQIALTSLGAADLALIPAEAASKGLNSLLETLALIEELKRFNGFHGAVLGVLPFRDRWVGARRTRVSEASIAAMHEAVGDEMEVLPSIKESEPYKQILEEGRSPLDLSEDLQYPLHEIIKRLGERSGTPKGSAVA